MNTKTITLTGSETAVKFDRNYPYFWVINYGDSDVYMSVKPGIVPDTDGVVTVPAGGGACSGDVGQADTLYLLGTGKVEVSPQFNAVCPFFKAGGKGGESEPSGGLSVGGRNYVRNGNFADGLNGWINIGKDNQGSRTLADSSNGYRELRLWKQSSYDFGVYQVLDFPISQYTGDLVISLRARSGSSPGSSQNYKFVIQFSYSDTNKVVFENLQFSSYAERYVWKVPAHALQGAGDYLRIYIPSDSDNYDLHISDVQIELSDGAVSDYRPAPEDLRYTLPVAAADVLGGVKVDGTTIVINDGVISIAPGLLG